MRFQSDDGIVYTEISLLPKILVFVHLLSKFKDTMNLSIAYPCAIIIRFWLLMHISAREIQHSAKRAKER